MAVRLPGRSSALPEEVRYFIRRKPQNTMIPLVPVDQLPYQIQGVPSEIGLRRMAEEKWKPLDEVSEAAVVLPILNTSPVVPRYRAPDHDVRGDAAVQVSEKGSRADWRTTFSRPSSTIEVPQRKKEAGGTEPRPLIASVEPSPTIQQTHAMVETKYTNKPGSSLGHTQATPSIEQKPLATTDTNENRTSRWGTGYTRIHSINDRQDISIKNGEKGTSPELRPEPSRSFPLKVDSNHTTKDTGIDNAESFPISGRSSTPLADPVLRKKKIYCTHWITHNECSWGFRCLYKHEMPPLDVLKKETGFSRYPRWYKEKMAIQSRGPSWMERRLQADKGNSSDETEMPAPREFPDPSTLRSMRQKSEAIVKQDPPTTNVTQEPASSPLLIDVAPTILPPKTASSSAPASAATPTQSPTPSSFPITQPVTQKKASPTMLRRHSQISWSSDSSGSATLNKQTSKNKGLPKKGKQVSAQQPKKLGLAVSNYAPVEEERFTLRNRRAPPELANPFRGFLQRPNLSATRDDDLLMDDMDRRPPTQITLI